MARFSDKLQGVRPTIFSPTLKQVGLTQPKYFGRVFFDTTYALYILHALSPNFPSYFTFIYRPTRNILLIPDDAVDRRKLGF